MIQYAIQIPYDTVAEQSQPSKVQALCIHSDSVPPAKGYQRSRNLADASLRRQQIELRGGIPRVQHLHPDAQVRDALPRLRAERHVVLADAYDQEIYSCLLAATAMQMWMASG